MEPKGASAEDPSEQRDRHERPSDPGGCRRQEYESERDDHQRGEDPTVASPCDPATAKDRREGGGELQEAAQEGNTIEARARHDPFPQRAVDAGERPEAVANDDDPVWACHSTQPWKPRRCIGSGEQRGPGMHMSNLPEPGRPGKCRPARFKGS
jgi:hypothetical protein